MWRRQESLETCIHSGLVKLGSLQFTTVCEILPEDCGNAKQTGHRLFVLPFPLLYSAYMDFVSEG